MNTNRRTLWIQLASLSILVAFTLPFWLSAQDVSPSKESALEGVNASQVERARRQADLLEAQKLISEAEGWLARGAYDQALPLFQKAGEKAKNAPASSKEHGQVQMGSATCYYELARKAYSEDHYPTAMNYAQQAFALDPQNAAADDLYKKASEKHQEPQEQRGGAARPVPPEVSEQAFVDKQNEVLQLYRSAENYYKSEQFDEAEKSLKRILKLDPYSASAYHRLREVQQAKFRKLQAAQLQTEAEAVLAVQQGWVLPVRRERIKDKSKTGELESDLGGKRVILEKLNDIKIPKIEFNDTPILTALDFLSKQSRELDPKKKGVNIFPEFAGSAGNVGPLPEAAPGPEGAPPAPPPDMGATSKKVTMDVANIPLLDAIKLICEQTGFHHRIEPYAVIISTHPHKEGRMATRRFPMAPGVFTSQISAGGAGAPAAGFVGISTDKTITRTDVKARFAEFGIDFTPQGSSVYYQEALSLLVATHYPDVLDQIEAIVFALNETPPQIQLETKFIDVSLSDLEELGFRWSFATRGLPVDASGVSAGGQQGGIPSTFGLRRASTERASALDALLVGTGTLVAPGTDQVLGVEGGFDLFNINLAFDMAIDALARKGYVNLLSAPRVTTTSGETARVLVTREFIYPNQYTDPVVQVSSGGGGAAGSGVGITAPSPSSFTTREVGVVLEVKPTIGADKYTINLVLAPEVVEFEGFINYNTSATAGVSQFTFTIPQPLFSHRQIETNIMIWDGQTSVLGGLIRDDTQKIDDKVPILGDIPFLGRLFRSKIESVTKRNLIIFLTARLVTPGGAPVKSFEESRAAGAAVATPTP